jgi:hypothetical protein
MGRPELLLSLAFGCVTGLAGLVCYVLASGERVYAVRGDLTRVHDRAGGAVGLGSRDSNEREDVDREIVSTPSALFDEAPKTSGNYRRA